MKETKGIFMKFEFGCKSFTIYNYSKQVLYKTNSVNELIEELKKYSGKIIWCYDLAVEGSIILRELIRIGLKLTKTKKVENGRFSYLISSQGTWYSVKFKRGNKSVELRNATNKIPKINLESTSSIIEILEEMEMQGSNGITIGSDCFREFRKSLKGYRKTFPELTEEVDEFCRNSYFGGLCICNESGYYENGYVYDVHSMYPYVMKEFYMPFGEPKYFEGEPPKGSLSIIHIMSDFELKEGSIATIIKKNYFGKNEQVEESDGTMELWLTSVDLELFLENYEIYSIEYIDGYFFKRRKGIFNSYIEKYYTMKNSCVKGSGRYKYAKLMLNNLSGKFGTKPVSRSKFIEEETFSVRLGEEHKRKTVYVPVAAFITAYARKILVEAILEVGIEHFRYCDTDSIHTDITCSHILNIGEELGQFDCEKIYSVGIYCGQKIYMLDGEITCAGLSQWARENNTITETEFIKGCYVNDVVMVQTKEEPKFVTKKFKIKGVK